MPGGCNNEGFDKRDICGVLPEHLFLYSTSHSGCDIEQRMTYKILCRIFEVFNVGNLVLFSSEQNRVKLEVDLKLLVIAI